jgi:acetyl esterase/lipase
VNKICEVCAVNNHITQPASYLLRLASIFSSCVQNLYAALASIKILTAIFAIAFVTSLANAQTFPDGDITPGAPAPLCTSSAPLTFTYVPFGSTAQTLDLYLPAPSATPYPTVIWIHSGGWFMGDKTDVASAKRLVCKGYAVASINYRLSGVAKFPAQIHDVKAAIRFLRANAPVYNLDANRFASFGSSAGGHLSSLVGSIGAVEITSLEDLAQGNASFSSSVRAAIAWFGPSDFAQMDAQTLAQGCGAAAATHGSSNSNESRLLGCTVSDPACSASVTSANPATHINATSAPMLFMHGTADCFVPIEQSSVMKAAMDAKSRPATTRMVVGADHGGAAWETSPVQDAVVAFLDFIFKRAVANDASGDGKSDLVFQNIDTGQISAWLMDGGVASSTAGLVSPGNWSVSHTADFNGDGKADILFRNNDGAVTQWLMNGLNMTSTAGLIGPDPDWRVSHTGDFNGDGKADILWRNSNGAVTVWLMDGITVTSRVGLFGAGTDWRASHTADFNGDGKADILWRNNSNGATAIWLMNGSTATTTTTILGADANWRVSHVADFDGDGNADLLWRNSNGAVTTWLMNGSTVASAVGILGANPDWSVTHTGDFNGDGKADILWRSSNGAVTQWLMSEATVTSATGLLGADPNWRVTHLGDYNGDGNADLVWRNTTNGSITMWLMSGAVVLERVGLLGAGAWSVVPPMP